MELIQKTIRYNQEGKKTFDPFYLDEDYNVPDAKQDVRRIIKGQGTVKIEDVKLVENYVRISGKLYFQILYVTDQGEDVYKRQRLQNWNVVLFLTQSGKFRKKNCIIPSFMVGFKTVIVIILNKSEGDRYDKYSKSSSDRTVSYTHLDVYKRQGKGHVRDI